ncbi:MAG: hypothetical protein EA392_04005 [Cryomorphaceae bacterium]|nr:MAG: hypothetical protein EA392_04005 [Cryomorphaceae bacterium]
MLELSKKILSKVSFDRKLFRKELRKAVTWVNKDELILLRAWCLATFGHIYAEIILEVFDHQVGAAV